MVQLRESLFLEKQKTVDTLRDELEQERREISLRAEDRLNQQLADQTSTIKVTRYIFSVIQIQCSPFIMLCLGAIRMDWIVL